MTSFPIDFSTYGMFQLTGFPAVQGIHQSSQMWKLVFQGPEHGVLVYILSVMMLTNILACIQEFTVFYGLSPLTLFPKHRYTTIKSLT